MIAVDSSSLIAFLSGLDGRDVIALDQALAAHVLLLPPAALAEILSEPTLPKVTINWLCKLPLLDVTVDFWTRAGISRAKILRHGRKARLGDTLIAQSCLDHGVTLITRDKDFAVFQKYLGLKLLPNK